MQRGAAEGVSWPALFSVVAAVVIGGWWLSLFLNFGHSDPKYQFPTSDLFLPTRTLSNTQTFNFGLIRATPLPSPTATRTPEPTSTPSPSPTVWHFQAASAPTMTEWVVINRVKEDMSYCAPDPASPCLKTWLQSGLSPTQWWQLWTPELPFVTFTPTPNYTATMVSAVQTYAPTIQAAIEATRVAGIVNHADDTNAVCARLGAQCVPAR